MVQELSRCRLMYHAFRKSLILTFVRFVVVLSQYSCCCCFMPKRAMAAKRNRYNVLKLKSMLHGATCGLLLSVLFWGSNLLLQCRDVEPNPGPPKADTMRQTRLGIGTTQQAALTTLRLKAKNRLWLTSRLCFLK